MTFPEPLEIKTDYTPISLWWEEGCPAELEMAQRHRYICQELEPDEARMMAAWLMAYADEVDDRADGPATGGGRT